jgi:hypothetical protein
MTSKIRIAHIQKNKAISNVGCCNGISIGTDRGRARLIILASLTISLIAIKAFGWIDYREIINDMAFPEMFKKID